MKKQLKTDAVENELRGASLFFTTSTDMAKEPDKAPVQREQAVQREALQREHSQSTKQTRPSRTPRTPRTGRTPPSVPPVTLAIPTRRLMIRHSFEVYQDQVESLRTLALQEKMLGGQGSMSRMAREGLDRVIAEYKRLLQDERAKQEGEEGQ